MIHHAKDRQIEITNRDNRDFVSLLCNFPIMPSSLLLGALPRKQQEVTTYLTSEFILGFLCSRTIYCSGFHLKTAFCL